MAAPILCLAHLTLRMMRILVRLFSILVYQKTMLSLPLPAISFIACFLKEAWRKAAGPISQDHHVNCHKWNARRPPRHLPLRPISLLWKYEAALSAFMVRHLKHWVLTSRLLLTRLPSLQRRSLQHGSNTLTPSLVLLHNGNVLNSRFYVSRRLSIELVDAWKVLGSYCMSSAFLLKKTILSGCHRPNHT